MEKRAQAGIELMQEFKIKIAKMPNKPQTKAYTMFTCRTDGHN